jgi:hypothetical protein
MTALQRFWAKIEVDDNGCWNWTGHLDKDGYGRFRPVSSERMVLTHRWSYETFVGPIVLPELDHVECSNRACSNPGHLEPVTHEENAHRTRKDECKYGHPLSGDNLYICITGKGHEHRSCRTCNREAARQYRQRVRN